MFIRARTAVTAAALALGALVSPAAIAQQEELVFATLLPLTGPGAPIGTEMQRGIDLAVEKVNAAGGIRGRKVRVIVEDSQGKPDVAVLSFNKLADLHNVPAVQVAYSSVALAVAPLANRKKVIAMNSGAQSDKLSAAGDYLISTIPLVEDEAPVLSKFVIEKIGKTAAVIYENLAAGNDGRNDFKKTFEALGGKVLAEEPIDFGNTNFRPMIAKVMSTKPDMVYVMLTQAHNVLAEQVAQSPGFPVGVGHTFSTPLFGYPGTLGWYQTSVVSNVPEKLAAEFKAKYPDVKELGLFAREYFNSANIIMKGMDKVLADGGKVTGETLRKAIYDIKVFNSDIANITFEGTNIAKRKVDIHKYGEKERIRIDFN